MPVHPGVEARASDSDANAFREFVGHRARHPKLLNLSQRHFDRVEHGFAEGIDEIITGDGLPVVALDSSERPLGFSEIKFAASRMKPSFSLGSSVKYLR